MDARHLSRFWAASALLYPRGDLKSSLKRIRFMADAWRLRAEAAPLLSAAPGSLLGGMIRARPQIMGFIVAPYVCCEWNARDRIAAFARHVATLERFGNLLDFELGARVELMALPHLGPDYHLVLDKPIWFHREGVAVLNLFRRNVRLMSLAFALEEQNGHLVALIGAIQGRDIEGIRDEFRQMTKDSFGIRPRDLLIDLFRALARQIGVETLQGIADAHRHHRSLFFSKNRNRSFSLNYDEIWQDRGGEREGYFFRISPRRQDRDEADIPARKRAMYRKRYELLDALEGRLREAIRSAVPVYKGDAD
jgi:uncharacterized protein VirK/YbjX